MVRFDEVATKEGLNPGQYAGFKVGFIAYVRRRSSKGREKKGIKGKLGQSLIRLVWVGAPETGIDIDFEFNFDFWPGGKNRAEFPNEKIVKLRYDLIKEELDELHQAITDKDIKEVADALTDILYVTYGAGPCFWH